MFVSKLVQALTAVTAGYFTGLSLNLAILRVVPAFSGKYRSLACRKINSRKVAEKKKYIPYKLKTPTGIVALFNQIKLCL
jgi:hypothetical protein